MLGRRSSTTQEGCIPHGRLHSRLQSRQPEFSELSRAFQFEVRNSNLCAEGAEGIGDTASGTARRGMVVSAIIFSGMLAVLFLSWALELRLPQINTSDTTESAHIGAPL